ncbi:unnamed protein product [Blepharisma stoltei]|uniref:Maturase K n=1 Tax=Blepharisma stoltei TaxID=1481888 RepID=A0AAU9JXD9_9CILI|nr:unnamed protein product [Blepharisma stoltei]
MTSMLNGFLSIYYVSIKIQKIQGKNSVIFVISFQSIAKSYLSSRSKQFAIFRSIKFLFFSIYHNWKSNYRLLDSFRFPELDLLSSASFNITHHKIHILNPLFIK